MARATQYRRGPTLSNDDDDDNDGFISAKTKLTSSDTDPAATRVRLAVALTAGMKSE